MRIIDRLTVGIALSGFALVIYSYVVWNAHGYEYKIAPPPFNIAAILGVFLGWTIAGTAVLLFGITLIARFIRKRKKAQNQALEAIGDPGSPQPQR